MIHRLHTIPRLFFFILLFLVGCGPSDNFAPVIDGWLQPSGMQGTHRVQKGETLYSIAWGYGLDYREVARINNLPPPYTLRRGQTIKFFATPTLVKPVIKSRKVAKKVHALKKPSTLPKKIDKGKNKISKPVQTVHHKFSWVKHWFWPAKGKLIRKFSIIKGNKGIEIAAKKGQPVKAAAAGLVVYSGHGLRGYGNLIILKHNAEYLSAYAHNSKLLVKEGTWVKAQQKIAEIGKTGTSRDKLHFEIRHAGKPVNPMKYLSKKGIA